MYYNLNKFTIDRDYRGQKLTFIISADWTYDDASLEGSFDFGTKADNAEYLRKFETGELVNVLIRVTACALNCVGGDYLGGCHIVADNAENNFREIIDTYGMVDSAIADCIREIDNQIETLTPFFVNLPK